LYRWKQQHLDELEASKPAGAQSSKEMAVELAEVRKQLAKSQRMNEILKKTVGYFSKED
jgi:transposase-like protein